MRLFGLVNSEEKLGGLKIPQVLDGLWGRVLVVVASLAMVAEAVRVLKAQIKALGNTGRSRIMPRDKAMPQAQPSVICFLRMNL